MSSLCGGCNRPKDWDDEQTRIENETAAKIVRAIRAEATRRYNLVEAQRIVNAFEDVARFVERGAWRNV